MMKQDLNNLFVIVDWYSHRDVWDALRCTAIMTSPRPDSSHPSARVAYFEPSYDFRPVLDEWSKVAIKELDFRNEYSNSERIRTCLQQAGLDVVVPAMVPELCTETVLVMDYAEGFKVTDTEKLDQHGIDREALIRRICQAFAIQVYVAGFFNW